MAGIHISPEYAGISLPSAAPLTGLLQSVRGAGYTGGRTTYPKTPKDPEDKTDYSGLTYRDAFDLSFSKGSLLSQKRNADMVLLNEAMNSGMDPLTWVTGPQGRKRMAELENYFNAQEAHQDASFGTMQQYGKDLSDKRQYVRDAQIDANNQQMRDMEGNRMWKLDEEGNPIQYTIADAFSDYDDESHYNPTGAPMAPETDITISDPNLYFQTMDDFLSGAYEDEIKLKASDPQYKGMFNELGELETDFYKNSDHVFGLYDQFWKVVQDNPTLQKTHNALYKDFEAQNAAMYYDDNGNALSGQALQDARKDMFTAFSQHVFENHLRPKLKAFYDGESGVEARNYFEMLRNDPELVANTRSVQWNTGHTQESIDIANTHIMPEETKHITAKRAELFYSLIDDANWGGETGMTYDDYFNIRVKGYLDQYGEHEIGLGEVGAEPTETKFLSNLKKARGQYMFRLQSLNESKSKYTEAGYRSLKKGLQDNYATVFAISMLELQAEEYIMNIDPTVEFRRDETGTPLVYQGDFVKWDHTRAVYTIKNDDGEWEDVSYNDFEPPPNQDVIIDNYIGGLAPGGPVYTSDNKYKTAAGVPIRQAGWLPLNQYFEIPNLEYLTYTVREIDFNKEYLVNSSLHMKALNRVGEMKFRGTIIPTSRAEFEGKNAYITEVLSVYEAVPWGNRTIDVARVVVAFPNNDAAKKFLEFTEITNEDGELTTEKKDLTEKEKTLMKEYGANFSLAGEYMKYTGEQKQARYFSIDDEIFTIELFVPYEQWDHDMIQTDENATIDMGHLRRREEAIQKRNEEADDNIAVNYKLVQPQTP